MEFKESEKSTKKHLQQSKCLMQQALSLFLKAKTNNQPLKSADATDTILNLIRHVRKKEQPIDGVKKEEPCLKCPKDSTYLIIGVYYFELFKSRLNKFKNLIIDKEFNSRSIDQLKEQDKEKNWDKIKLNNCDSFSDLINLDSQEKIFEYLKRLIDIWNKLLEVKENLNANLINQLDVFEILKSCFFIFTFYGVTEYVRLTCQIYLGFVLLHAGSNKNHILFAYYCRTRLCLDNGLVSKAKDYLARSKSCIDSWIKKESTENKKKNLLKNLSTEIYLIKIAECELNLLMNDQIEETIQTLKNLLKDEYFKSITVISGYIKCLIYFLCTKFSAKQFENQDLYHYFNESFVFTKSLFNKWYPFLNDSDKQSNKLDDKKIEINSPIWLEFAVTKFTLEFSLTYYYHSINCSVVDIHFFFNILVTRLARIYCSLLWLSRILILSCYYEKIEVQKVKINQAKNLFIKKKHDIKLNGNNEQTYVIKKQNLSNLPTNGENESVILQDDNLDLRSKEYANCSHEKDTPIYLLKKSMLKNPILNEEIEVLVNYDYDRELANLDNYLIPDLIIIKQELLLLLHLINESKQSFIKYFKQLNLDNLNSTYFDHLSRALKTDIESLNRNNQNLITSKFNLQCLLIYLKHVDLDNNSIFELSKGVLKKATKLGHSYEIHCFIAELVLVYIESLFTDIFDGKLNIIEYDFLECDKFLVKPLISNSPVQQRFNLRSRIKPSAPKKVKCYKMDEIKDYIQEIYDLNCQQNSVKLNFTESDDEENNEDKDKENLKLKIKKLKSKNQDNDELGTNRNKIERESNEFKINKKSTQLTQPTTLKKRKANGLSQQNKNQQENNNESDYLNDLNDLNSRIGHLCLDDTFDQEIHEYLIDESSNDYYDEFKKLLNTVLDLFGNYPSIKHYNTINSLLFRLSICKESKFAHEAAYYFSEICQANALRYKTIHHLQKKYRYITTTRYDSRILKFDNQIISKSEELEKMIDILPRDWRVVQIQFIKGTNSQTDLYMARYQRNEKPIVLKIKINSEKLCQNFTDEFNEIIHLSNDTAKEKDSKSFWKLRFALDERLKRLLIDVNSAWINCFIGLFLGECTDSKCKTMFKKLEDNIMKFATKQNLTCLDPNLLKVICESFIFLKEESFNHAMVSLFTPKNRFEDVYDSCLEVVKQFFQFNTLEGLKEIVTKRIKFGPTGLITGSSLENFPLESLFGLRMLNLDMFRIPSVRFLNWMYINLRKTNQRLKQGVSDKDVYYLINPSNNLSYTEEFFKIKFEELKKKENSNWNGLIGEIPKQIEIQKELEKKDIYIYFGHNSGVRYLGRLYEYNINCLSLVMGCSSAALTNEDQMVESFGSSYFFLINGCPTYVGCLWNVTDRDIDRFAERLLKHTFKIYDQETDNNIEKCSSVAKAVALSRDVCKLKYLNGSAPIIRGLPISIKHDDEN